MTTELNISGWVVSASDDGQYLYIKRPDKTEGEIHIKAEGEGIIVDIWNAGVTDCIAGTGATYREMETEN